MSITVTIDGQTRQLTLREETRWEAAQDILLHEIVRLGHTRQTNPIDDAKWKDLIVRRRDLRLGDTVAIEQIFAEFSIRRTKAKE